MECASCHRRFDRKSVRNDVCTHCKGPLHRVTDRCTDCKCTDGAADAPVQTLQQLVEVECTQLGGMEQERKTQEDLARRARRVCIRLASMGNRCYWLSAFKKNTGKSAL